MANYTPLVMPMIALAVKKKSTLPRYLTGQTIKSISTIKAAHTNFP